MKHSLGFAVVAATLARHARAGADNAAACDFRDRRSERVGGARSGPDRRRRDVGRQDRARGVGSQQRRDGQGAAGAQGRRHRRKGLPDLAAVAAAAICRELQTLGASIGHRQLPRQQPCHGQDPRRHQGRERDRRAGRRRRQRDRRHQFHGDAGLKASGRSPREGDRGRPPQGRDLRQGRRRDARRADQYFRGRRARAGISRQGGRADGRRRAGGARRRDAIGDGERDLGDQGERSSCCRPCERRPIPHDPSRNAVADVTLSDSAWIAEPAVFQ